MDDKKIVVIGHFGQLPNTGLIKAAMSAAQTVVIGLEVDMADVEARLAANANIRDLKELNQLYSFKPPKWEKPKKIAPWGKKAKRSKHYG